MAVGRWHLPRASPKLMSRCKRRRVFRGTAVCSGGHGTRSDRPADKCKILSQRSQNRSRPRRMFYRASPHPVRQPMIYSQQWKSSGGRDSKARCIEVISYIPRPWPGQGPEPSDWNECHGSARANYAATRCSGWCTSRSAARSLAGRTRHRGGGNDG